jgi:recombination protein RecA
LKFYSSIRVDIRKTASIKDGEEQLGSRVKVKVVKNKLAAPFRRAEFDIIFGEGISRVGEVLDIATENDIVKKSGSWFSYGDRKLGQGRDAVKTLLQTDAELMKEIEEKVIEVLKKEK